MALLLLQDTINRFLTLLEMRLLVFLALLPFALSAVPQWHGPDSGSGATPVLQTCVDQCADKSAGMCLNDAALFNPKLATFITGGFEPQTNCMGDDCLMWSATATEICEKVFGQSCLKVIGENCGEFDCSTKLYELDGIFAESRVAYCNVQCPAGTYNTAAGTVSEQSLPNCLNLCSLPCCFVAHVCDCLTCAF